MIKCSPSALELLAVYLRVLAFNLVDCSTMIQELLFHFKRKQVACSLVLSIWFYSFIHEVLLLLYPPGDKWARGGLPEMRFKSTNLVVYSL